MTVAGGLVTELVLCGLAVLLALVVPARVRSLASGAASVGLGVAGVLTGVAAMAAPATAGLMLRIPLPETSAVSPLLLAPTPLGGLFSAVVGAVGAVAALYGIGYAHGPAASRTGWSAYAVFLLGMLLVTSAGDVVTLLLGWETMALGSTILLLAEHAERSAVRPAALWYAVMTHLSFLALVVGFGLLAHAAHSTSLAKLSAYGVGGPTGLAAFFLLLIGFATKAGLVPFHVWLPRAHPEAPSHASAVMSAAMVAMGVYGIILLTRDLLPKVSSTYALVVLALGVVSASYGILQASVSSDLKRLLAYSTTENVGLAVTAIGLGMLLENAGQTVGAAVAQVAALLLVVSHAAFKTVLFLGAGSILKATGLRDLDALGGLVGTHPVTTWTFGVAALGASALPVTSGFVAEWALLQAIAHGDGRSDTILAFALPVTLGLVALTIGLGLLTFVKAFGTAFLARPRSEAAAAAVPEGGPGIAPATMATAQLLGAATVVGLGLAAGPLASACAQVWGSNAAVVDGLGGVRLASIGVLDPVSITLLAIGLALPVGLLVLVLRRRTPRRETDVPWGCGGVRTSPRMEYTATSYAEPLVRVFGEALRPARSLEVAHTEADSVLESRVAFAQEVTDLVEVRGYAPAATWLSWAGDQARRIQNGSINRYLGFSFAALLVVLLVVTIP